MGHSAKERRLLRVSNSEEGQRLDRWLAARGTGLSRVRIQRLIESGQVRVNGKVAVKRLAVRTGDEVEMWWSALTAPELAPENIPLDIIFEDEQVLVVSKSPGMVVHPVRAEDSGTLVHALRAHTSCLSTLGGSERPGIVHRLDKGTSGILVVAKTDEAHLALTRQFKARAIEKRYRAVVWGSMPLDAGDISAPLGRHRRQRKKMMVRCDGGREADTAYEVEERLPHVNVVRLKPGSGRTHQLRVHAAYIGHPIFGDAAYGGRRIPGRVSPRYRRLISGLLHECPRQALHAEFLAFDHPGDGRRCRFCAPLPEDIGRVIAGFRELGGGDS
ncbi:MAG: RluA family pseudouridine synthase [Candidatus Eisenbacteria sp.]|nr:RluA family pseudouridine synthase [Candidatus Eisenbacteria bacterium]